MQTKENAKEMRKFQATTKNEMKGEEKKMREKQKKRNH